MNTSSLCLDRQAIAKILPHTGQALVIDTVHIQSPTEAIGYFLVQRDDPRITSHFGIMPGVLIAEFAHLTGAVLLMHAIEEEIIPALNETHLCMTAIALPGDALVCKISLNSQMAREFFFSALISIANNQKQVATVSFTGTRIPKRIFDRQMQQQKRI